MSSFHCSIINWCDKNVIVHHPKIAWLQVQTDVVNFNDPAVNGVRLEGPKLHIVQVIPMTMALKGHIVYRRARTTGCLFIFGNVDNFLDLSISKILGPHTKSGHQPIAFYHRNTRKLDYSTKPLKVVYVNPVVTSSLSSFCPWIEKNAPYFVGDKGSLIKFQLLVTKRSLS